MQLPPFPTKSILSALAGLAFTSGFSAAAPVPDPVAGDLFLAFRASGGEGASDAYLVKLGLDTPFRNATPGTSFVVSGLGNIGADLTAKYGADWNTRSDLFWGIFGHRTSTSSIVYGSKSRIPASSDSSPWPAIDGLSRNATDSQITSVLDGIDGYRGRQATANSTVATFQPNFSGAASYNYQVATLGTTDFGSLSAWSSIEGDFGSGTSGTALDLYRIAGSGVTRVGKFTISSSGVVTFTAPAPAAPVDTDGDGFLDSQEVVAGTSPTNPSDFFKVQSVTTATGATGVSFNGGLSGRTYKVFYSENLSGSWIEVYSGPALGTPFTFTDNDPTRTARPKGFYKVSVTQ